MADIRKLIRSSFGKRIKDLREKYPQYEIGRGSYGGLTVLDWKEGATLTIGAFCSFADCRIFLGGEHRTDWVTTYPFNMLWKSAKAIEGHPKTKGDVVIGNDVWAGQGTMIMSGVTVGDGAVVGAGTVVTKDIPAYAIAAGNPARIIRMRFDDITITRLLELKWWNWDEAKIEKFLPLMLSSNIKTFLDKAERPSPG